MAETPNVDKMVDLFAQAAARASTEYFFSLKIEPSDADMKSTEATMRRLFNERGAEILKATAAHGAAGNPALGLTSFLESARALGVEAAKLTLAGNDKDAEMEQPSEEQAEILRRLFVVFAEEAMRAATGFYSSFLIQPNASDMRNLGATVRRLFDERSAEILAAAVNPGSTSLGTDSLLKSARDIGIKAADMTIMGEGERDEPSRRVGVRREAL